jgi:hypothetical protein
MNVENSVRAFHPCSFKRSEPKIEAMGILRPLLDQANATSDEKILLDTARACEEADLPILAELYRKRAGQRPLTEHEKKKVIAEKALQIIVDKKFVTPLELQQTLGLTRRSWQPIASYLKKNNLVEMVHHRYIPKCNKLL